ncbi:MAG: ParA family protein [Firmicutes bacterium]|nr:ParA family protein [Bacillota bacterium]
MAYVITLTNQKGGVGKTTSTSSLISGLTARNKKVLGIDLDPQGNLGFSLGIEIEDCLTIYEALKGQSPLTDVIQETSYGDVIPSNILLSGADREFTQTGREFMIKNIIDDVKDKYDYIIIDTPPALNILTVNAYVAADALIIPMVPEILSLLGVSQIKETIDSVKKFYNPNLNILGILLTKYNSRLNLAKEVQEMSENIAEQLGTRVFETKIRAGVSVAEAPAHGESIFEYAPKSNPAVDYTAFVDETLRIIGRS